MNIVTGPSSVLPLALQAMQGTPDRRLRDVMASLTRHLHAFVQETALTEAELECALDFINAIGQASGATRNEAVLAADILGLSTLVALQNNQAPQGDSSAALLGPFWRAHAPQCQPGDSIARSGTPGLPLVVAGTVCNTQGEPVEGATVDVWQASPVGLYENQDAAQDDMNLRGRFQTDAQGRFHFSSVRPAGYPVPTERPVWRAAARATAASQPPCAPALHGQQGRPQGAGVAAVRRRRREPAKRPGAGRHPAVDRPL